jgi:hypothetical protein
MGGVPLLMKFKKEVSDFGAEACLPANLPDEWIDYLDEELRSLGDAGSTDVDEFNPVCALAAVVMILSAKHSGESVEIPHDKLFEHLIEFRIELGLEIVSRRSNIKHGPATINNIFARRSVECWEDQ